MTAPKKAVVLVYMVYMLKRISITKHNTHRVETMGVIFMYCYYVFVWLSFPTITQSRVHYPYIH